MNFRILSSFITATFVFGLSSCDPELADFEMNSGTIDFTNYVAIGGSDAAGYCNESLYTYGQQKAYTTQFYEQVSKAFSSASPFLLPLVEESSSQSGLLPGRINVGEEKVCDGSKLLGPYPDKRTPLYANFDDVPNLFTKGPFKNMAIPKLNVVSLQNADFGALNPYYKRIASRPAVGGSTIMDDIVALKPTFVTIDLGLDEVFDFAAKGAQGPDFTDGSVDGGLISPVAFEQQVRALLEKLQEAGTRQGIVLNIPDVANLAFFNAIPYNYADVSATQAQLINTVNGIYSHFKFREGPNAFVIVDEAAPAQRRQMKPDELVVFSIPPDSLLCAFWGTIVPIPPQYIINSEERKLIANRINELNAVLVKLASEFGLAFFDRNAYFKKLQNGVYYDGVLFSTAIVTGQTFSLDGYTLSDRGQGLIANELIKTANSYYKANIPQVNVSQLPGILVP